MADPQISIEAEFKDGKLHTGLDRAAQKEEKMDEGLRKISQSAKQAERELERFAKRTTEINATPAERYAAAVARADQAIKAGKISQETYNREVARQATLLQANQQAMQNVGREQKETLGPSFLGQIQAFVGGYLSLQAAVQLVAEAFRHAKEESREALASLRGLDDSRRRLNQIAGSPEELDAMIARADAASVKYGVDRKVAYDTLFSARNFGIDDRFEELLAANQLVAPDVATNLGGKMQAMFGGKVKPM
jgi:hypothetical protein